jgi:hypothetical protein
MRFLAVLCATALADGGLAAVAATPLAKVVQLLTDLKTQVSEEGQKEAVLFNEFSQWCDGETYGSKSTIGDSKSKAADLQAYIEEQEALQEKLKADIDEVVAEISSNENDLKSAKEIRDKEHSNYKAAEEAYVQSLDELTRAVEVLQNPNPSFVQATKSVQAALERTMSVTPQQQATIKDFFAQTAQGQGQQQQQSSFLQQVPYKSRTGELVQTLQQIKDETSTNRNDASREEASSQHAFELLEQSLDSEIKSGNKQMSDKKMQVSKSQEVVASSTSELDNTNKVLSETLKYLQEVETMCKQKTLEWKERTKLRSDEVTAITEAIEILQSDKGQAVQNMELQQLQPDAVQVPAFLQLHQALKGSSFVQMKTEVSERFLTGQQLLAEARAAAAAGAPDPFKNVRKLINEMIQRLLNEAAEEAEHKGWCDTEMGKSEIQKDHKEKEVKSLTSRLEEMNAQVAQLDDEIRQLTKNIAEAEAMDLQATKVRQSENTQSLSAVKEYQDAQSLIQNAMTVLQEFYNERAQKQQSLVQVDQQLDQPNAPDTFDGGYESKDASGVLGILEISMSDFARLESETKTAEAAAQNEYQKLMQESAIRKATLTKDLEYKQVEKQKMEGEVQRSSSDLTGFKSELDAVVQYIEKLKPSCTNTADSHEVRKERREAEIKSLQEALAILNNEGI